MMRLLVDENLTKNVSLNTTKTNKDNWHKTKTTFKIGDEMNTREDGYVELDTLNLAYYGWLRQISYSSFKTAC